LTHLGKCDGINDFKRINRSWSFEEFCEALIDIPYECLERHLYPQSLVATSRGHYALPSRCLRALDRMLGREVTRGQIISEIYRGEDNDFSIVKLENFREDLKRVCLKLNKNFDSVKIIRENQRKLPNEIDINDALREKIYNYYRIDFKELGYEKKS